MAPPKKLMTTKTMVPYTLSKRYQDSKSRMASKAKAASLRKAKKPNSREEGDSDSDGDEPVSFFSHLDTPHPSSNPDTFSSSSSSTDHNVSNSYPSVWSGYSSSSSTKLPLSSTAVPLHPSTTSVTPSTNLANSAPVAPKPFRIAEPNYDPVTGIYSYGDSTQAPPTTLQGYDGPREVEQTGLAHSHPEAGGWEQYYAQEAEQDLSSGDVYYEAHQQDYQRQQGPTKPMPGAGPGLGIDDDVVRCVCVCVCVCE